MADLKKNFYSPPKGGNGKGVPTENPMASPPTAPRVLLPTPGGSMAGPRSQFDGPRAADSFLSDDFSAGVLAARSNFTEARRAGPVDFRNFRPGSRQPDETSARGMYDEERLNEDRSVAPGPARRVSPVINPDTSASGRSDGKQHNPFK